jgi:molecular chaperone GrpE
MSDDDATDASDDPAPDTDPAVDGDDAGTDTVPTGEADAPDDHGDEGVFAPETLIDRVADHDPDLAEDVRRYIERGAELHEVTTDLEAEIEEREAEVEDLRDRLRRTQADFQNYKKRAERERERIEERATEDLVERLLDVRDDLRRAVEEENPDVESLLDGVEMTLREFDGVLDDENVAEIAPEPGDEIDPTRHEVMMRADSDQPEDTVADVYAPGYEMAGEVIRPARVTVSTGPPGDDAPEADAAAGDE